MSSGTPVVIGVWLAPNVGSAVAKRSTSRFDAGQLANNVGASLSGSLLLMRSSHSSGD